MNTNNNHCGCCLAEGCSKDMFSEFFNGYKREIYAEVLQNTFNIQVPKSEQKTCKICEKCITRLQDARSFKQEILKAQDSIQHLIKSSKNIKEVTEMDSINHFDHHVSSDHFSDSDFIWDTKNDTIKDKIFVINLEPDNRNKKISIKNRPDSKSISNTTLIANKLMNVKNVKRTLKRASIKAQTITSTSKKTSGKPKSENRKRKCLSITQTEVNSRANTLKLVENSNLCLFVSQKTKFACFICRTAFVDVSELREHSTAHSNSSVAARINRWRGLSFKNVDISQLKCKLCSQEILNLTELMSHLKNIHQISFEGADNFLIPYKLKDGSRCVLCDANYNSFLRLSIHMNSHYSNNVCEICGSSFINRMSLRMHVQSMHKEKKCSLCPAKFLTVTAKVKHLKKEHNYYKSKRYCNLCDKTFRYTYLLRKHKIDEHGAKQIVVNCKDCGKTFFSETNLKIHIRSVHIRERNHQCEICGTRFFTKFDQKRHEDTHNDTRSISCSYCDVKFKSTDSYRRHVKKQHGRVCLKKA